MTEPGKTVGRASCILCGLENQPVKVSKKGHLYFTCAPAADGGCEHQMFARGATSDRLLAQQITRWSSQEEKKRWLGNSQQEPEAEADPEEQEELEEAITSGEIEIVEPEEPAPAPKPRPRMIQSQPVKRPPAPAKKKRPLPDFAKMKKEKKEKSWSPF